MKLCPVADAASDIAEDLFAGKMLTPGSILELTLGTRVSILQELVDIGWRRPCNLGS